MNAASDEVRQEGICKGRSPVWVCGGFMEVHTTLDWELETSYLILLGYSLCPKHQRG